MTLSLTGQSNFATNFVVIKSATGAVKSKIHGSLPALILGLAIFVYAAGFSYLTVTRYAAFEARALDLGNLHQTVWNTANGLLFHMTNQPGTVNRLSLHVEPILLPIAALYWLYDGPETLLILQSIVVALGAWPLYALAQYRLRNRAHKQWLALLFGLVFLLNPTIQAANWLEFHPVTLAPTFLMAAFYFLQTKRNGWFALFALLAVSCKEEMGLLLFMLGGYALVILRRPKIGLVTMGLSLGWSLLAVLGVQQFFADGNIHWGRYDYLGASPLDKVIALFTQPQLVWAQLQQADALGYLFRLLWPVGFVALLAPEVLLLAFPSLAINLLADFPPMHEVYALIYAVPILPFVMLAMVEGAGRVAGRIADNKVIDSNKNYGLRFTVYAFPLLIAGSTLLAQFHHGYLPGGGNYRLYPVTGHDRRAASIIAQIPSDAKVAAQDKLDPHVAGRETIYIFPRVEDADTIFVDVIGSAWPQHPSDLYADLQRLLAGDFGVTAGDDGYLLLRKAAPTDTIPEAFYSTFRSHPPNLSDMVHKANLPIIVGHMFTLLAYQVTLDGQGETITQLYWQLTGPPVDEDYHVYVAYTDDQGTVMHDTLFYPPVVTLWYPTSMWQPEETILVQTLPWQLDVEQFTLLVGLYRNEDGWNSGQRLPISTPATPDQLVLEGGTVVRLAGYQRSTDGWLQLDQQLPPPKANGEEFFDLQFGSEPALFQLIAVAQETIPQAGGDPLNFALQWRAGSNPIDFDYAIFAHLLNEEGEKVAQLDWQPHDRLGLRPMTTWFPDTTFWDHQELLLPEGIPAGNYRLQLGVYNWQTGDRLAIRGNERDNRGGNEDGNGGSSDVEQGDTVTIARFSIK